MKKIILWVCVLMTAVGLQAENSTVKLDTLKVNYVAKEGDVLKGTLQRNVRISIFTGAHITLENVTINGVDNSEYDWPGIACRGDATIKLVGTNNIKGFRAIHPGIEVSGGSTLTITGDGTLYASSNGRAAGIGAGWCGIIGNSFYEQDCGSIIIEGGTIYSVGGMDAAGIGGSKGSYVDDITITSGVTKVVATGGNGSPHAIGKGVNGHGVMTVNVGGKIYTNGGTAEGTVTYIPWTGNLANLQDDSEIKDGSTITGTLRGTEKPYKITIPDKAHIKLSNALINTEGSTRIMDSDHPWAGLTCNGDATIELVGTNKLSSFSSMYPGIYVPEGKTLTIKGAGSLVALTGSQGAGIGGATYLNCGNIRIEGGDVEAVGGPYAASIGVGNNAHCGSITITSGVTRVKATKGAYTPYSVGAGGSNSSCGTITVGSQIYTTGIADNPFIYPVQAPIDESVTPAKALDENQKVIINGQLMIKVGDKMYDAQGKEVK